jgi:hypothetical protein
MLEPNFEANDNFEGNHQSTTPSTFTQDRDLFLRLSQYLDAADINSRQGRGWFIFNADRSRAARILRFMATRLEAYRQQLLYSLVSWRDFSLNSYMLEVELGDNERNQHQLDSGDPHLKQELHIARRVTYDTSFTMLSCDLLMLSGLQPHQPHEIRRLEYVISKRQGLHLATILLTPHQPHELAAAFSAVDSSVDFWNSLYRPMYETGLLAF